KVIATKDTQIEELKDSHTTAASGLTQLKTEVIAANEKVAKIENELTEAKKDVVTKDVQIKKLEDDHAIVLSTQERQLDHLATELKSSNQQIALLEEKQKTLNARIFELTEKATENTKIAEKESNILNKRIEELTQRIAAEETSTKSIITEKENLAVALATADASHMSAKKDKDALLKVKADLEAAADVMTAEIKTLKEEKQIFVLEQSSKTAAWDKEKEALSVAVNDKTLQLEALKQDLAAEITKKKNAIETLEKEKLELTVQLGTASDAKKMVDDELETLAEVRDDLSERLAMMETELSQSQDELRKANSDLNEAKVELGQTKNELDQTKNEMGQTKGELDQKKNELADLIQTQAAEVKVDTGGPTINTTVVPVDDDEYDDSNETNSVRTIRKKRNKKKKHPATPVSATA
ncbi:hypothetical protein BGZ95_007223, partial [Linnemannia exigua]